MEMIKRYPGADVLRFKTTLGNPRLLYIIGKVDRVYLEEVVKLPREAESINIDENGFVLVAQGNPVQLEQLDKKIKFAIKRVLRMLKRLS